MFFSSSNLSLGAISTNFWQAEYYTVLFLLVHFLQYAPQPHRNNTLVPWLSYQLSSCYIFQHAPFLCSLTFVFCFRTCFELITSVVEHSNLVLEILSGHAMFVHNHERTHERTQVGWFWVLIHWRALVLWFLCS